jgi:hypothetical protein
MFDVRLPRVANCDTDNYLDVEKVRERLAVNKQGHRRFHMEMKNVAFWDVTP